jgi:hypothetical protein
MKLTMMLALAAGMAWAGESVNARTVAVCADQLRDFQTLQLAKAGASRIFATAGVQIQWHQRFACPKDAILVTFSQNTPRTDRPGALAYALPYEGTHVVVFYDRMEHEQAGNPIFLRTLLAHVLVHEITHILQGIDRHSETGVMKARWDDRDFSEMRIKPLPFTASDVDLIQRGVDGRSRNAGLLAEKLTSVRAR